MFGGAAIAGMAGGTIRDLYEGNYKKAAVGAGENAAMMYGLAEAPEAAPLLMMKAVIDADTP